jgi:hypothetical protein
MTLTACGNVGDTDVDPGESVETTGMALNADLIGGTDVVGFRFKAVRVKCSPVPANGVTPAAMSGYKPYVAEESLQEVNLPGDNYRFEKNPYSKYSSHHFADHFFSVRAGCYNLIATPIDKYGDPSEDCATATLYGEEVYDDKINEFHLISQCRGKARTALDVMGSLNHPPEVKMSIDKFMCAGAGVVACATASDPDGDPLKFTWKGLHNYCYVPKVVSWDYNKKTGETTQCVVIPSYKSKSLPYKVIVKDLAWNGREKVPIETLLPKQSGVSFDASKSRASIKFPAHALDDCTPGGMAFIGVTLGADLHKYKYYIKTDENVGMSKEQATKLARNAINYVNPNLLGDSNPRILVVRDTADPEDPLEDEYIKQRLKAAGFSKVVLIDEPKYGLSLHDTISYAIVWFVNPGFPIDNDKSYRTLREFRKRGGGVIISGDDANQNVSLRTDLGHTMSKFSFMRFDKTATNDNPNGTRTCGELTDNNEGKVYNVHFTDYAPLAVGIVDRTFYYGNDIDRNIALDKGEKVNAVTKGLKDDLNCLGIKVPVMTTVPAGKILPSYP